MSWNKKSIGAADHPWRRYIKCEAGGAILDVCLLNSGNYVATALNDGVIRIWSITDDATGGPIFKLTGHKAPVANLSLLPSGELVSSGRDMETRFWVLPDTCMLNSLEATPKGQGGHTPRAEAEPNWQSGSRRMSFWGDGPSEPTEVASTSTKVTGPTSALCVFSKESGSLGFASP